MVETLSKMRYEELIVWQKSMDLVDMIYDVAKQFPREERFGLYSQITRAAVSIPSNIAEGNGRNSSAERVKFIAIARGSLYEVNTQYKIAIRRKFCHFDEAVQLLINEIARMLTAMLR